MSPSFGWDKIGDNKSRKKKANDREKDQAEAIGATLRPASGATDGRKGDYDLGRFLFDSKHSSSNSIIVGGKDLTKITREANDERKNPALVLSLDKVAFGTSKEWVLVPMEVFSEIVKDGF